MANETFGFKEDYGHIKSFDVSKDEEFGDLLNYYKKKEKVKVGVYTCAWYEYFRMYPKTLERDIKNDVRLVLKNIKEQLESESEIIWPGLVTTMDEADNAGRIFKSENIDLIIFVMFNYTSDAISIQCLKYVLNTPIIIFLRQSHKNTDFNSNYESILRNCSMIGLTQLTGTFKKMDIFNNYEVVVGADFDKEPYIKIKKYFDAVKTYIYLRELNVGIIGHVFRGMFDHEFDRTRIAGFLGPDVINIQISHLLDLWNKVKEDEVEKLVKEISWIKKYPFQDVRDEELYKECKFAVAYKKLIKRFRLDACCYLGQHYVQKKTGCSGYLANVIFAKGKKYMTNTEGDIIGLIMMCIMNKLTGQTPLFAEWGEFGEKENAIQLLAHGYADLDYAKNPDFVKITATPEYWGHTGAGFSFEFTTKPGIVTIGHFIDDKDGWRMLISKGEALEVGKSIPVEDVALLFKPSIPVKEFVRKILKTGFDHHAIACYGDITEELGYIADLMGIQKSIL